MNLDRLDKQFKEKLKNRTIEPSDQAWDRLDAMLSVAEKKKSKKGWLWIAASLVVFATIGSLFLRTDKGEIIPTENLVEKNQPQKKTPIYDIPEVWHEEESFTLSEKEYNSKVTIQDSFRVVKKIEVPVKSNNQNNITDNFNNNITENFLVEKNETVEVEPHEYITGQDLLKSIKDDNHNVEKNTKSTVTIDYKSLLYQAEMEVEQQYRKNAIDRFLQKSYDNVKVATLNKL